jgi:predicted nucleic acid-binding protein
MSSPVCVDASLSLKLILAETDSHLARALWERWVEEEAFVIAPPLWGYEVTSVIRNRAHRGLLSAHLEKEAASLSLALPVNLINPAGLHQRAAEIARRFNRPAAYDAHYLALAEMAGCSCWTADERLYNAVHSELDWVHWLGNYPQSDSPSQGEEELEPEGPAT